MAIRQISSFRKCRQSVSFLKGFPVRVAQGFSSDETATFVFSFKRPLFSRLRAEFGHDAEAFAEETWIASELLDRMGMLTIRAFQKSREAIISRQQEEMLELSTPVVRLLRESWRCH